ncbi:hypothetical protein Ancab_002576 [Ancistrocladus abbreviatus]
MDGEGWPEKFKNDRMAKFSSQIFKTSLYGEPTMVVCGAQGHKFLFSNENKLVTPWWPSTVGKLFPLANNETHRSESIILRKVFQNVIKVKSPNNLVKVMDMIAQSHFASSWESNRQVQVYPLAKRYGFWLACHLLVGMEKPEEIVKFERGFNFLISAMFSIPIDFPGTSFNRGVKASRIIRERLMEVVKQRKIDMRREYNYERHDVLSHMLLLVDENGQHMSNSSIANRILGLLIGGHDTASSAITFIIKYLAELPHVYNEVFKDKCLVSLVISTILYLKK